MADPVTIRQIAERNTQMLALRPERGKLTGRTMARLAGGLRCEIEEGAWRLVADMPGKAGGDGSAPTPGVLGRGALASCLAIGIGSWAARLDIPLDAVEVEVAADFDARGELGVGDVRPGYSEVRYRIEITSPAPAAAIAQLLDRVERHSPYLEVFGRATPLRRQVHLNGQEVA